MKCALLIFLILGNEVVQCERVVVNTRGAQKILASNSFKVSEDPSVATEEAESDEDDVKQTVEMRNMLIEAAEEEDRAKCSSGPKVSDIADEEDLLGHVSLVRETAEFHPKLNRTLAEAEDPEEAMQLYLDQIKMLTEQGERTAVAECVRGETCTLSLPVGSVMGQRYTLESELPCTGESDLEALTPLEAFPSVWSSPREGRKCSKGSTLGVSSHVGSGQSGLEECRRTCNDVPNCLAISYTMSTGNCTHCRLPSTGSGANKFPKGNSEVHVRTRLTQLLVPSDVLGRRYICGAARQSKGDDDSALEVFGWVVVRAAHYGQSGVCFSGEQNCKLHLQVNTAIDGGVLAIRDVADLPEAEFSDANSVTLSDVDAWDESQEIVATLPTGLPVRVLQFTTAEGSDDTTLPERAEVQWEGSKGLSKGTGWISMTIADSPTLDLTELKAPASDVERKHLEDKLWKKSHLRAQKRVKEAGCVGSGAKILARGNLETANKNGKLGLGTTINTQQLGKAGGLLRMCYCPTGQCDKLSESVGFLRLLPPCPANRFVAFTNALEAAHEACKSFNNDCEAMRANATCMLEVDPLLFSPVRRFSLKRKHILGEPLRDCWAWARDSENASEVTQWRQKNPEVWEFAMNWESCGKKVQRVQVCGGYKEGGISRWVRRHLGSDHTVHSWTGKKLAALGHGVWFAQRKVRDAVNAISNLATPDTYEGREGKLACPPTMRISRVTFASYGNPREKCGEMQHGSCNAGVRVLQDADRACFGKRTCQLKPFGDKGESKWPLTGENCEALKQKGGFVPSLMMEATCTELSENVLESIVQSRSELDELNEKLEVAVKDAVKNSNGNDVDVVDDVCSDCTTILKLSRTRGFKDVCSNEKRTIMKRTEMCAAAVTMGEADFVSNYTSDVEAAYGKSLLGSTDAVDTEVCKDMQLCGFHSNAAVAALFPTVNKKSNGRATVSSLRNELLKSYEKYGDFSLTSADLCEACINYAPPHVLSIDLWDMDWVWQTGITQRKGHITAKKDNYLGGVTVDISEQIANGQRSGDFRFGGVHLQGNKDWSTSGNFSGNLYFSWTVDLEQTLTLQVVEAHGLKSAGWTMSDPYAMVRLNEGQCNGDEGCNVEETLLGQKQVSARTPVLSNTRNPFWNHTFSFKLSSPENETPLRTPQASFFHKAAVKHQHSELLLFRRAFGSRVACMHLGMCEFSSNVARTLAGVGLHFGSKTFGIRSELSLKKVIDERYDNVMKQIMTYPCRSIFVPKNMLLMFTTWHDLQFISKKIFSMRHVVDEQYMTYIHRRNQQVLRGLFYSDVISAVPSYLRGLIEESVRSMLTGQYVSWERFILRLTQAFKRFALGAFGRALAGPVLAAVALVQFAANAGKAVFYDFLYKFVIQGVREGKSAKQFWHDVKNWVLTRAENTVTSTKEAIFGSDKCSNTADGLPSYATGLEAKKLFAVEQEEEPATSMLEVAVPEDATESICKGVNPAQYNILVRAAGGASFGEIQALNDFYSIGACFRWELQWIFGKSCTACFTVSCYCNHWALVHRGFGCPMLQHRFPTTTIGGFSVTPEWYEATIYKIAQENPGSDPCALVPIINDHVDKEITDQKAVHDAHMMAIFYAALLVYILVYLVCVKSSVKKSHKGSQGARVARSGLKCTLWPLTFGLIGEDEGGDEFVRSPKSELYFHEEDLPDDYDDDDYDEDAYDDDYE